MVTTYDNAINTGELDTCVNAVIEHYAKNMFMNIEALKSQVYSDFKNYDEHQRIERVKVMCSDMMNGTEPDDDDVEYLSVAEVTAFLDEDEPEKI